MGVALVRTVTDHLVDKLVQTDLLDCFLGCKLACCSWNHLELISIILIVLYWHAFVYLLV